MDRDRIHCLRTSPSFAFGRAFESEVNMDWTHNNRTTADAGIIFRLHDAVLPRHCAPFGAQFSLESDPLFGDAEIEGQNPSIEFCHQSLDLQGQPAFPLTFAEPFQAIEKLGDDQLTIDSPAR